jgi:hypothetical protein
MLSGWRRLLTSRNNNQQPLPLEHAHMVMMICYVCYVFRSLRIDHLVLSYTMTHGHYVFRSLTLLLKVSLVYIL